MSLIQYYKGFLQLGYVTKDLDRAVAFFDRKLGARNFFRLEAELPVLYRGETRQFAISVALGNVDDHQIEIIQPISGAIDFYSEGTDMDRQIVSLHHIGLMVPGPIAAWDKMVTDVRAGGDEFTVLFAPQPETEFQAGFAYVDTRELYGHYTEYLWRADGKFFGPDSYPELAK